MNIIPRRIFAMGLLLAPALVAQAQTMFTVTGTANSTAGGYTSGQSYTFVFVTGASFRANGISEFNTATPRNLWVEETAGNDQLWAVINGTGVSVSFIRPIDPYSMLRTMEDGAKDQLLLWADGDNTTDIGLRTPGGQAISHVFASLSGVTSFAFPGVYSEPNAYFSAYLGNYIPGGTLEMGVGLSTGGTVAFTATNLTIAAVPEPAAYAVWAGLMVLAVGFGHRLRRTARRSVPTGAAAP